MVDVVEEEARGRDDAQVEGPARRREVRERRPVGVERERDEAEEPLRLVLQVADAEEVVDPLLVGLDRPVEHRDVRLHALEVAEARDLEPPLAVDLVRADDVADPLREDLRSAAGAGVHPGVPELADRLDEVLLPDPGEPVELDHRPGLDVDARESGTERSEESRVVVVGERGVEPADDVELGDAVVPARGRLADGLFDRHRVAAGDARLPSPRAEAAVDPAEVRRVQVAVDVVVAPVPVPPLSLAVREGADAEEVRRAEEDEAVLEREPLAGEGSFGHPAERGVGEPPEEPFGRLGRRNGRRRDGFRRRTGAGARHSGTSSTESGREISGGSCCSATAFGWSSSCRPS